MRAQRGVLDQRNVLAIDIGPQLRTVRLAQGKSLRSVAAAVGVSPSLLSQVENSKTSPSVSTLYALVSYLGVSLDLLTSKLSQVPSESSAKSNSVVQRRRDNLKLEMQNGVIWERLADTASNLVDPLLVTYEPGAGSSMDGEAMKHDAAEFGFLIEGSLKLSLDGEIYEINAGDSFSFDANRKHRYLNDTLNAARGIWFVLSNDKRDLTTAHNMNNSPESAVEVLNMMKQSKKKSRD